MAEKLTGFQRKKILRVFTMLYDTNKDGVIEKQDFDDLLDKICHILEWQKGGEKHEKAKNTLDIVWNGLENCADKNRDAKITKTEWLNMWGACLAEIQGGPFPDWQEKYMELMFDVNDKSGDNLIDSKEYETFLSNFEVSSSECNTAFAKIAGGSDKCISRSDFEKLWRDYLTSNDPSSSGNFLFGPNLDKD